MGLDLGIIRLGIFVGFALVVEAVPFVGVPDDFGFVDEAPWGFFLPFEFIFAWNQFFR